MFRNRIIILVILALSLAIVSASAANTVTLDPQSVTVSPGSNSTVTVRVDEFTQGLAGYQLRVTLTDPGVAEIIGVSYPIWAKLSNSTGVPSDSVTLSAVDIDRQIGPGARDVVLGTFTVHGDATGSTGFVLSDIQVDADGGAVITLVPSQGTIIQPMATSAGSSTTITPAVTQGTTGGSTGGGSSTVGSSSSSGSTASGQSTPVNGTTVMTSPTPVITGTPGTAAPVQVTSSSAAVVITSSAQPVTTTMKGGIPIWGVGFICLFAIGITLLVFVRVKRI